MSKDFEAGMRKVIAEASYVYLMSQLHIVHILLSFGAPGLKSGTPTFSCFPHHSPLHTCAVKESTPEGKSPHLQPVGQSSTQLPESNGAGYQLLANTNSQRKREGGADTHTHTHTHSHMYPVSSIFQSHNSCL